MSQDNQPKQQPDASDEFKDQIGNVPEENLKSPVNPGITKPTIPKEDFDEAHQAKEDMSDEEQSNE